MFAPPSKDGVRVAPGAGGGANWSPTSYDAAKGVLAAFGAQKVYRVDAAEATAEPEARAA